MRNKNGKGIKDSGGVVVSDEVQIILDLELIRETPKT
jgi:hypothetical protein